MKRQILLTVTAAAAATGCATGGYASDDGFGPDDYIVDNSGAPPTNVQPGPRGAPGPQVPGPQAAPAPGPQANLGPVAAGPGSSAGSNGPVEVRVGQAPSGVTAASAPPAGGSSSAWSVEGEEATVARRGNESERHAVLDGYGQWVATARFGRVWRPSGIAVGWRPYSRGRWLYRRAGWTWRSDYPWGWVAFHYGRWVYDDIYGWVWVPGNTWGPAWVTWTYTDSYIGWAPLPPWRIGYGAWGGVVPNSYWCFAPRRGFRRTRYRPRVVPVRRNPRLARTARVDPYRGRRRRGRVAQRGKGRSGTATRVRTRNTQPDSGNVPRLSTTTRNRPEPPKRGKSRRSNDSSRSRSSVKSSKSTSRTKSIRSNSRRSGSARRNSIRRK